MTFDPPNNPLSSRRHALILASVEEFIPTAGPVGSAQIVAHHKLGVRAAMVRNMMAELEDGGYLHQPHTSAGRVRLRRRFATTSIIWRRRRGSVSRIARRLSFITRPRRAALTKCSATRRVCSRY